jgi:hypothetical protein
MKTRPVGAKFFHVDGHTDMTKLIVALHNFLSVPKKGEKIVILFIYALCVFEESY